MVRPLEDVKTIYLDFDGTLHNTIVIYGESLRAGYRKMKAEGVADLPLPTDEEAQGYLGHNAPAVWKKILPDASPEVRERMSRFVGEHMNMMMEKGQGKLFPRVKETLDELKRRGYTLVFMSNCKVVYKENVMRAYGLESYFSDFLCSEAFDFIPKHEILRKMRHRYPEGQMVVGDRFHDMEAAYENDLPAVFCRYGFGDEEEGKEATAIIDAFEDLLNLL